MWPLVKALLQLLLLLALVRPWGLALMSQMAWLLPSVKVTATMKPVPESGTRRRWAGWCALAAWAMVGVAMVAVGWVVVVLAAGCSR